jgi:hypothetical protein
MPLDRAHLTVASRIMVPAYVVFFGFVGANFMLSSFHRLVASPMLRYADQVLSIRLWGALFATCALLMLAALMLKHRDLYRFALLLCAVSMSVWTLVAIAGVFVEPISYSAWVWPALVATACFASNRSLVRDNRRGV